MIIDEVMQVFVPIITQFTYFSKPEQEYGTSSRHLTVPSQFTPTKIVDSPDAIDFPYLEIWDLNDIGASVGRERY